MGKKGGSAPAAPDPEKTAAAQYKYNQQAYQKMLEDSRITSGNMWGQNSWSRAPSSFDKDGYARAMAAWEARKPSDQSVPTMDLGDGSSGMASPLLSLRQTQEWEGSKPLEADFTKQGDWSFRRELNPELAGTIKDKFAEALGGLDGGAYNQDVAKAIYDRSQFLVDPQTNRDRAALEQRLAERGFQVQNEGYVNEMDRFEQMLGRGRTDASNAATIAGMQEGRAQNAERMQMMQLLGGLEGQLLGNIPVEANVPGLSAPDFSGLAAQKYQGDLARYNADVGSSNALLGTLGTLGSAALMASGVGAPAALAMGLGTQAFAGGPASGSYQLAGNLGAGTGLRVPNLYSGMR